MTSCNQTVDYKAFDVAEAVVAADRTDADSNMLGTEGRAKPTNSASVFLELLSAAGVERIYTDQLRRLLFLKTKQ